MNRDSWDLGEHRNDMISVVYRWLLRVRPGRWEWIQFPKYPFNGNYSVTCSAPWSSATNSTTSTHPGRPLSPTVYRLPLPVQNLSSVTARLTWLTSPSPPPTVCWLDSLLSLSRPLLSASSLLSLLRKFSDPLILRHWSFLVFLSLSLTMDTSASLLGFLLPILLSLTSTLATNSEGMISHFPFLFRVFSLFPLARFPWKLGKRNGFSLLLLSNFESLYFGFWAAKKKKAQLSSASPRWLDEDCWVGWGFLRDFEVLRVLSFPPRFS